jgi:hypothetical protein
MYRSKASGNGSHPITALVPMPANSARRPATGRFGSHHSASKNNTAAQVSGCRKAARILEAKNNLFRHRLNIHHRLGTLVQFHFGQWLGPHAAVKLLGWKKFFTDHNLELGTAVPCATPSAGAMGHV